MARGIQAVRIAAILLGIFITIASVVFFRDLAAHVKQSMNAWRCLACLMSGIFLIVPHRRIFRTRAAPMWLALSFLLPTFAGYGLAMNAWAEHVQQKHSPLFWVAVCLWVVVCGNAVCARDAYRLEYARK